MRTNLKQARQSQKLTQQELGEMIGMTKQAICRLERGYSDGSRKTWQKLAAVLDAKPEDLWRQENDQAF